MRSSDVVGRGTVWSVNAMARGLIREGDLRGLIREGERLFTFTRVRTQVKELPQQVFPWKQTPPHLPTSEHPTTSFLVSVC